MTYIIVFSDFLNIFNNVTVLNFFKKFYLCLAPKCLALKWLCQNASTPTAVPNRPIPLCEGECKVYIVLRPKMRSILPFVDL